jgi:hypothetical protein
MESRELMTQNGSKWMRLMQVREAATKEYTENLADGFLLKFGDKYFNKDRQVEEMPRNEFERETLRKWRDEGLGYQGGSFDL